MPSKFGGIPVAESSGSRFGGVPVEEQALPPVQPPGKIQRYVNTVADDLNPINLVTGLARSIISPVETLKGAVVPEESMRPKIPEADLQQDAFHRLQRWFGGGPNAPSARVPELEMPELLGHATAFGAGGALVRGAQKAGPAVSRVVKVAKHPEMREALINAVPQGKEVRQAVRVGQGLMKAMKDTKGKGAVTERSPTGLTMQATKGQVPPTTGAAKGTVEFPPAPPPPGLSINATKGQVPPNLGPVAPGTPPSLFTLGEPLTTSQPPTPLRPTAGPAKSAPAPAAATPAKPAAGGAGGALSEMPPPTPLTSKTAQRVDSAVANKDAAVKKHLQTKGIKTKAQFMAAPLATKNQILKEAWEAADPATRPKSGYKPWREGHEPSAESMLRIMDLLE